MLLLYYASRRNVCSLQQSLTNLRLIFSRVSLIEHVDTMTLVCHTLGRGGYNHRIWGLAECQIMGSGGLRDPRIALVLNSKSFAGEGGMTVMGGIPFGDIGRRELPEPGPILLGS